MRKVVVAICLCAGLTACISPPGQLGLDAWLGDPPSTLRECLANVDGYYASNAGSGAGLGIWGAVAGGAISGIASSIERHRCREMFGQTRVAAEEGAVGTEAAQSLIQRPDRSVLVDDQRQNQGYALSPLRGAAYGAAYSVEFGAPGCRVLNGAINPAC